MTTQTMNNELTLEQLDTVNGGTSLVGIVVVTYVIKELIEAAGDALEDSINPQSVMDDGEGNGDYRRGPSTSNSPPNPFG
ncbi:MAG: CCRG-2 family RiPP [Cyanobacteria bacterium P01_B01_bin.77]